MKNFRNTVVAVAALCLTMMGASLLRAEDGKSAAPPAESTPAAATPSATPSASAASPVPTPAEVSSRLQELQDEMDRIQGEMSSLKKQLGASTTAASPSAIITQAAQSDSAPAAPAAQAAPAAPAAPAADQPSALAAALGPISVTGFVDGYYEYNLNHPRQAFTVPGLSGPFLSSFRTFDGPTNQFSLNMTELTISKAPDAAASRLGYTLTFGFGNAENVVNSTEQGAGVPGGGLGYAQPIKEAYMSYLAPIGKGLQIDFGKFVTPAGAEVIETNANWNYSRGFLFNYSIPFNHYGLRAKYTFNDKVSLTGYLVNGWNNITENNTAKTLGASLAWTPNKKWTVTQNYLVGPEQANDNSDWRQLSDTVVAYNATSKLSLMANYDYGHDDVNMGPGVPSSSAWWQGVAGYLRYAFNDKYAFAGRYEYFDDHNGYTTGTKQGLNEFTATFERIVAKHLITRWEYRRDMSNWAVFAKGGEPPIDHQDTFTGGLIYSFDVKDLK